MDYTRKEAAAEFLRGGAKPELPREQQLRQAVEHVRSTREWVEVASNPDNRDAYISEEMAKARSQNTLDGVLVAPEEAFAKLERVKRDKYDERVMQEARAVLELLPEVLGALEEEAQSFESLPPASMEPARRTLQLAERNELRLRFNDRPLAELLTLYIKSDDQSIAIWRNSSRTSTRPSGRRSRLAWTRATPRRSRRSR
jgi:hypothetical protein